MAQSTVQLEESFEIDQDCSAIVKIFFAKKVFHGEENKNHASFSSGSRKDRSKRCFPAVAIYRTRTSIHHLCVLTSGGAFVSDSAVITTARTARTNQPSVRGVHGQAHTLLALADPPPLPSPSSHPTVPLFTVQAGVEAKNVQEKDQGGDKATAER